MLEYQIQWQSIMEVIREFIHEDSFGLPVVDDLIEVPGIEEDFTTEFLPLNQSIETAVLIDPWVTAVTIHALDRVTKTATDRARRAAIEAVQRAIRPTDARRFQAQAAAFSTGIGTSVGRLY